MIGLAALLAVGTALVGGDRLLAVWLEKRVADGAATAMRLEHDPKVRVHGFPAVTQLSGGLRRVDVEMDDVPPTPDRRIPLSELDARLDGVEKSGDQVHVDSVTGTVRITYDDLAAATGLAFRADASRAGRVVAEATVPILGAVQVSAEVSVTDGSGVTLGRMETPGLPDRVADRLVERLTKQPVATPALPDGVSLSDVATDDDGITVRLTGTRLALSPDSPVGT
ncbi:DUF2993 domain-containing protein [Streptomyces sp. NPDC091281]|uniref:LmeA family phospholipid-binding protein n=1 Tax=Streptomyces sp. NPDC091281 TaxID=3365985 RepID=UPI0037FC711B